MRMKIAFLSLALTACSPAPTPGADASTDARAAMPGDEIVGDWQYTNDTARLTHRLTFDADRTGSARTRETSPTCTAGRTAERAITWSTSGSGATATVAITYVGECAETVADGGCLESMCANAGGGGGRYRVEGSSLIIGEGSSTIRYERR